MTIHPPSCWFCRNSDTRSRQLLDCKKHAKIVMGEEAKTCDDFKDSRKSSQVIPERGRG